MKKILVICAFATFLFSCKKDYTCTCVTTVNGFGNTPENFTYTNVSRSTAKTNCLSSTGTSGPAYTERRECTLE